MNSDVSFVRAYIVPSQSSTLNGSFQKLLHRRQDLCNSAKKPPSTVTTIEQTLTFIEQLKRNQHKSLTDVNHSSTQIPKENGVDKKTLTPNELCYQLNIKLEYLIRTRVIERNRVINRSNILPQTPSKSKATPRETLNRTTLSYLNQSRQTNVVSSSTTTTNTTLVQEDLVDKDSLGDNDEAFEEMVEEENITFLQQQP
jgi:hypothetical protein